jgi:hypothetical protein
MTGIIEAGLVGLGVAAATAKIVADIIAVVLSTALSFGLSALSRKKQPSLTSRRQELHVNVRDAAAVDEIVVGKVTKGGSYAWIEALNNDSEALIVIVHADHKVHAIDEIYYNGELAIRQNGFVMQKFRKNVIATEKHLGADDQAASPLCQKLLSWWTPDHRGRGRAYTVHHIRMDRDIFPGLPTITVTMRGLEMLDTRDDAVRYTNNSALFLAWHLNDPVRGMDAPYATDIEESLLNAAANICDEDVPIKAGQVLHFDGIDDQISVGDFFNLTGARTIEARIYPENISATQIIAAKDNGSAGYAFSLLANGAFQLLIRGLTPSVVTSPNDTVAIDSWQHLAGVYDPAAQTLTLFRNGTQVAQATGVTGTPTNSAASFRIAGVSSAPGFLKGKLQDVRLWDDARSASEINAFKDRTLDGDEANLVFYLPLDEKSGTLAQDATEIGNDADISGAMWTDESAVLGTQRRYQANGVIFTDQTPASIIEDILSSMVGNLNFSGGLFQIRAGAFETPTVVLDENDARDTLNMQTRRSRRDLFNAIRGTYTSPENNFQVADFPIITNAAFEAQDGPPGKPQRIVHDIELPLTTSSAMAQRIAFQHLLRNRLELSVFYPAKLKALRLTGGAFCQVNNSHLAFSFQDFEVANWKFVAYEQDGGGDQQIPVLGVDLELREAAASVYNFNPATDEIPVNPSLPVNLPSPFGPIAIVSDFVDRNGFADIARPSQAAWPGTYVGFVKNPLTGHLNVQDQVGADGNNFDVFDNYVQQPVAGAYYEAPEIELGFEDTIRTYAEFEFVKGPGEIGAIRIAKLFDFKEAIGGPFEPAAFDESAFDMGDAPRAGGGFAASGFASTGFAVDAVSIQYNGYQVLNGPARASGKYFKHRVEFDFSAGAGGYLRKYTPVIDGLRRSEVFSDVDVPVGGKTFEFQRRFHNLPALTFGANGAVQRLVMFPRKTTEDFDALVFDNAAETGGNVDIVATGI